MTSEPGVIAAGVPSIVTATIASSAAAELKMVPMSVAEPEPSGPRTRVASSMRMSPTDCWTPLPELDWLIQEVVAWGPLKHPPRRGAAAITRAERATAVRRGRVVEVTSAG